MEEEEKPVETTPEPAPAPVEESIVDTIARTYKKQKTRGRPQTYRQKGQRGIGRFINKPDKEEPTVRKERIPFGVPRTRLPHVEDKNFVYRVFNDNWRREPDRIQRAREAGYKEVEGYEPVAVGTNEDGTAIQGILMRIPRKFYEEDQGVKMKEIDKVDQEIHRGKFQEKAGDKRYIPPEGIKITN